MPVRLKIIKNKLGGDVKNMEKTFNYIVPIFNQEKILPDTLNGIEKCSSIESKIILIVDGCTDRSEEIVDEFIKNASRKTEKIIMPNVHMLLSVNEGLKKVTQGYSVIMQDDIVLEDTDMEEKIVGLYNRIGPKLGVISMRYGSNIGITSCLKMVKLGVFHKMIEEIDVIKNPIDSAQYLSGDFEKYYPRMSAINGPNVIPWRLLSEVGSLDPNLAPYGFDDPEYCLRALQRGYGNGLFPLQYKSEVEWGGTRKSKSFKKEAQKIHLRNRKYVYHKHKKFLHEYLKTQKIFSANESL